MTMDTLDVRIRTEEWFLNGCSEWTTLLNNSAADRLFLSWTWHSIWWKTMSSELEGDLCMLTASTKASGLIGIVPLFVADIKIVGRLPIKRVQFLVAPWQSEFGVVSEHLDIIAANGFEDDVGAAFARYLMNFVTWDEIALAYVEKSSKFLTALQELTKQNAWYARLDREIETYAVDTSESIENYVQELNGSTRRKMFNKRKALEKHGCVVVEYAREETLSDALTELRTLHKKRWDSGIDDINWDFFEAIARHTLKMRQLIISVLKVDGKPISAHYNIHVGQTVYNLFSAIDDSFCKKFSPGWIHFGYEIETAFQSGVKKFDLLAGPGKTEQYKKGLGDPTNKFLQIQFVRNKYLIRAYRIKDAINAIGF